MQKDSAAEAAGVRAGDILEEATLTWGNGKSVTLPKNWVANTTVEALRSFSQAAPDGAAVELRLTSTEGESRLVRVPLTLKENENAARVFGIHGSFPRVGKIQPGSPLAALLEPGAEVVTINGQPAFSLQLHTILERSENGAPSVDLGLSTGETVTVERDTLFHALSTGSFLPLAPAPTVSELEAGGLAESLGMQDGDVVLSIGGEPANTLEDDGELKPGSEIVWRRGTAVQRATLESDLPSTFGAKLRSPARISYLTPGGAAARAGFLPGDFIVAVGEKTVAHWLECQQALAEAARAKGSDPTSFRVLRDGAEIELSAAPERRSASLGVQWTLEEIEIRTSLGGAVAEGWNQTIVWGRRIFMMIGALARRDVAAKNLAGPVGIVHIGKRFAEQGLTQLLFVLAMISINLGVFNLLPFPILDGGHLLFLLIEKIKGSPVSENIQGWVHFVAFILLISLALFVTYHDLLRLVQ